MDLTLSMFYRNGENSFRSSVSRMSTLDTALVKTSCVIQQGSQLDVSVSPPADFVVSGGSFAGKVEIRFPFPAPSDPVKIKISLKQEVLAAHLSARAKFGDDWVQIECVRTDSQNPLFLTARLDGLVTATAAELTYIFVG